ncbi:MAG TPA: hypothetical protein VLH39_03100 [Magnetospirillaceae bacterium]|nr:hypothetical protein [Magnetospirillaceae bacterium]
MKRVLSTLAILTLPMLLLAAVHQTVRFQVLRAEALRMEDLQEDWIEQNRRLHAAISVLSSRSRVDKAARESLGLSKARPEGILRIRVEGAGGGKDG